MADINIIEIRKKTAVNEEKLKSMNHHVIYMVAGFSHSVWLTDILQ